MNLLIARDEPIRRVAIRHQVALAIISLALAPLAAKANAADPDAKPAPQRLSVRAEDPDSAARLLDAGSESATPIGDSPLSEEQAPKAASSPAPPSAHLTPTPAQHPTSDAASEAEGKPAIAPGALHETLIEQPAALSASQPRLERAQPIKAEAAHFNGVQPGGSTRADLREKWGSPQEIKKIGNRTRYMYSVEPFEQVSVTIENDRIAGIAIVLGKAVDSQPLAQQLRLDDCQAVIVTDEKEKPIGEVYPEHGVLFGYASSGNVGQVARIVIEPIDPQAFLVRAEERLKAHFPAHALADARFATELDPKNAVAHAVAARALGVLGRPVEGCIPAEEAMRLDPKNRDYRFLAARLATDAGETAKATGLLKHILMQQPLAPLVEARAYVMLGDCLAQPGDKNFSQAIEHHQHAIRIAERLAADNSAPTRRVAKMLLLEAHLAVARDIALGQWSHKHQAAMKWLGRAKTLAEELVTKENVDSIATLEVYETAMMVWALAPGKTPAEDWIAALKVVGGEQIDAAEEVEARGELQWRLGLALADAMVVERTAGKTAESMSLGEEAAKLLADSEATIDSPDRDPRAGQLYYRLGALQAIERANHREAVVWYDKALPLLEAAAKAKPNRYSDPAHTGDMLVSMAVSYWETGARERAVRLSQQGAKAIEAAVEAGTLPRAALAVPYSNLSSMLLQQGDMALAGHYSELAAKAEHTAAKEITVGSRTSDRRRK